MLPLLQTMALFLTARLLLLAFDWLEPQLNDRKGGALRRGFALGS